MHRRKPITCASPTLRQLFNVLENRQITEEKISHAMNMFGKSVGRWRRGVHEPRIMSVEALAQELGYRLVLEKIKD